MFFVFRSPGFAGCQTKRGLGVSRFFFVVFVFCLLHPLLGSKSVSWFGRVDSLTSANERVSLSSQISEEFLSDRQTANSDTLEAKKKKGKKSLTRTVRFSYFRSVRVAFAHFTWSHHSWMFYWVKSSRGGVIFFLSSSLVHHSATSLDFLPCQVDVSQVIIRKYKLSCTRFNLELRKWQF